MRDWSLHLLDLMENSLRARAKTVRLSVRLKEDGWMEIALSDDGCGIPPELLGRVTSPFATTRTTRRVGMGLSLARQNAERSGGSLSLESEEGRGTAVTIRADSRHIDCLPLGDLAQTFHSLICLNPNGPDFEWELASPKGRETFSTKEIKSVLGEQVSLNEPEVRDYLKSLLEEQCQSVFGGILQ